MAWWEFWKRDNNRDSARSLERRTSSTDSDVYGVSTASIAKDERAGDDAVSGRTQSEYREQPDRWDPDNSSTSDWDNFSDSTPDSGDSGSGDGGGDGG